jgi:hypothetical protein
MFTCDCRKKEGIMFKKTLALVLIAILLQTTGFVIRTSANNENDASLARKVRADVMGFGKQAHVKVKLKDNTSLEGYIGEIGAEQFLVMDARSGSSTVVAYSQVKQVKRNNLSTGAKIGIGVGVAAAVGVIIAIVAGRKKDTAESTPRCTGIAQVGVPCPPGCICILQ